MRPYGSQNGTRYPEEFKQQIVNFYNAGISVAKFANEYGLIKESGTTRNGEWNGKKATVIFAKDQ